MNMPVIEISFRDIANINDVSKGKIVALIIEVNTAPTTNPLVLNDPSAIPASLTVEAKTQIEKAFIGNQNRPLKVIVYFKKPTDTGYDEAKKILESCQWDYLAIPKIVESDVNDIVAWLATMRENGMYVKAVLPFTKSNKEYIINFTTETINSDAKSYTAAEYCSRIAGLLAGTPLNTSATYSMLADVSDCTHLSKSDMDTAVNDGELIIFHDGEKVKLGRAINSLTGDDKDLKKIKIVEIIDTIKATLRRVLENRYIGKYSNNYDNKIIVLAAMGEYFDILINEGVIEKGYSTGIDIDAQTKYLQDHNIDTETMTEKDILEANTGSSVFLCGKIRTYDAIEDIYVAIER